MKRASLLVLGAALFTAPAFAQSTYTGSQVQLDDSHAGLNIHVNEADAVDGAAIAGSNSLTVQGVAADLDAQGSQYSWGDATARTRVTAWHVWGDVNVGAQASGNSVYGAIEGGDINIEGAQTQRGDTRARTELRSADAWASNAWAAARANTTDVAAYNGDLHLLGAQTNKGDVSATAQADLCCISTEAAASSTASANSVSAAGYTTTMLTATNQRSHGDSVQARTDLYAGYAGDAIASASAAGNTLTATNQWGYANVAASQSNRANIIAEAYVTLGGDWLGYASAAASGVGNSAAVSNVGSDTVMTTEQANSGFVGAYAALAGNGGDADANSAAYGNVVTGALCNACGEAGLTASNAQVNDGRVESVTTIRSGWARSVSGSATAIGNAASYSVSGQN